MDDHPVVLETHDRPPAVLRRRERGELGLPVRGRRGCCAPRPGTRSCVPSCAADRSPPRRPRRRRRGARTPAGARRPARTRARPASPRAGSPSWAARRRSTTARGPRRTDPGRWSIRRLRSRADRSASRSGPTLDGPGAATPDLGELSCQAAAGCRVVAGQAAVLAVEKVDLEVAPALRQVVRRAHAGRAAADDRDRTGSIDGPRDLGDPRGRRTRDLRSRSAARTRWSCPRRSPRRRRAARRSHRRHRRPR